MGRGRGRGGAWVAYDRLTQYGATAGSPPAPTDLAATAISDSAIDLTWAAGAGGRPVEEYAIERSEDGATYAEIGTTAGDTTDYADTGLDAETEYTYRVRARNQAGYSTYCAPDSAETEASGPAILFEDDFEDGTYGKWDLVQPAESTPGAGAALAGAYGARLTTGGLEALNATGIIAARPASGALRLAWAWRVPAEGLVENETNLVEFLNDWDVFARLTVDDGVPTVQTLAKDGATSTDTPLDLTLVELADGAIHAWALDYDDSATPTVLTVRRDGVAVATVEDSSAYGEGVEAFWWTAGIGFGRPAGTYHDVDTVALYDGIPGV